MSGAHDALHRPAAVGVTPLAPVGGSLLMPLGDLAHVDAASGDR
ncbi:hypothetical protein [Actinoplanes philippinensis]